MIPTTLEECFQALTERPAPDEQVGLMQLERDELVKTHRHLGQWIRNKWGLWSDSALSVHMKSLGFTHPDDMSSSIIKEFWLRLRGEPSELATDIVKYAEFWKKA